MFNYNICMYARLCFSCRQDPANSTDDEDICGAMNGLNDDDVNLCGIPFFECCLVNSLDIESSSSFITCWKQI